ncbi:MAG: DUF4838 domain-containing protein, partial [Candidatus Hydrogenedentes bacterium]|nr:DUF4838 domain-containing protein [Candidatus Hydrogenedentota bacterium]
PDAPPCACPKCTAVLDETGTLSGLLIGFVNRVSEELATALPDNHIRIHTIAAGRLRRPPHNIEVADNVLVQVSAREADYNRPLEDRDSAVNLALRRDLDGWSGLTRQLYIWDFAANTTTPLTPHPNLAHIQANLQFYDQFLAQGVYADGWAGLPFSELDALRQYLYAIHLWDPDYGIEKARRDFFRDYYVQALAPMMAYVDLITKKVEDQGVYLTCTQDAYWFDYGLVEEARALFDEALAQRMTPEVKLRVQQTQLALEWAAMACPPRITVEGETLHFERPACLTFAGLEGRMREAWPGLTAEALEPVLAPLGAALPDGVPPREERHPFSTIENDRYLLWIAPSLDGAVVRFQDKETKTELLRGYRNYGAGAGVWAAEVDGVNEGPGRLDWTLKDAASDVITLEAESSRGIALIRTIRLDADGVRESVTVHNTAAEKAAFTLRTGPELFIQERHAVATCWTRQGMAWEQVPLPENDFGIARGERSLAPAAAHAVFLAAPGMTLNVEVEGDPAPALFTYDGEHQHQMARLQTLTPEHTLGPGESVRLALRYTLTPGPPDTSGSANEAGQR